MTREEIEKAILDGDAGMTRDDEVFKAQCVMMASAVHGRFGVKWLANFTGLPQSLVSKFSHNLRKSGVWKGRRIHANWADEEDGGISFALDSMIAVGMMQRAL